MEAVRLKITGMVQGVGFRFFTRRCAQRHGLTGYVKNLPDGSVECLAEGSREALQSLILDVKQGPTGSRVDAVATEWLNESGGYPSFNITY